MTRTSLQIINNRSKMIELGWSRMREFRLLRRPISDEPS